MALVTIKEGMPHLHARLERISQHMRVQAAEHKVLEAAEQHYKDDTREWGSVCTCEICKAVEGLKTTREGK